MPSLLAGAALGYRGSTGFQLPALASQPAGLAGLAGLAGEAGPKQKSVKTHAEGENTNPSK